MESYTTISVEQTGSVLIITLDRPEVLNAFDQTMQDEIRSVWRDMRTNDSIHVAIITGSGDRAFCVGIDRNQPMTAAEGNVFGTSNPFMYDDPGNDLGPKSCDMWKPVIVAVNGMACGGAFYLLAEADIILAADHATFFDPHVTYGMAAVYEPMKMLNRMPFGEVLRMSLVGAHEKITAATAMRMGLVSEVTAAADLMTTTLALADVIASQPPLAVQTTLRAIWAAHELSPGQAMSMAPAILANGMSPAALAEGQKVFESKVRITPKMR
jgi:enoyl-CoA hydratase/carnithine racemase